MKIKTTLSGKEPATEVEGHKIQKPRLLDAKHDREVSARNEVAIQQINAGDAAKITEHRGPPKEEKA